MKELHRAFRQGYDRSQLRTTRAGITRGCFDGLLLTMLTWGFGPFWLRVLYCLAARLVYGAIASSERFSGIL